MTEPIGALRAELSANHAQFERDMAKAKEAARRNGQGISAAMGRVGGSFENTMKKVFSFKTAMAGVAAVGGLAYIIKQSMRPMNSRKCLRR